MPYRYTVRTIKSQFPAGPLYGLLILYALPVHCTDLKFYMTYQYTVRTFSYIPLSLHCTEYSICPTGKLYVTLILYALSVHCEEL